MYGNGLIYINSIDEWKNKIRLTVIDCVEETEMYVLLTPNTACNLAKDLSFLSNLALKSGNWIVSTERKK